MNIVLKFWFLLACLTQSATVDDGTTNNVQDEPEKAILAAAESYVSAFNSRDAEKLAQLWAEKATYALPDTGEKLVGRDAIREMFAKMFAGPDAGELSVTVETIRFVTPEVAVETGKTQVVQADGNVSYGTYSAIHVKQNEQWLLDSIHEVESVPVETVVSPLSKLDWLVGEWTDKSEGANVETVCQWTKNNSFLTRSFRVSASEGSASGTSEFEGTQVIGWDPVAGHIRSWVFDSDGAYSEGVWQQKGESWVVESSGFNAEGQLAKSIQVYLPQDANTYTWQSFGRQVGDEALPNIDEIQVIRK